MSLLRGDEVNLASMPVPAPSTDADQPVVALPYFTPVRQAVTPTATSETAEYRTKLSLLSMAPFCQLGELARSLNITYTDNADLQSKIPAIAEADCVRNGFTKLLLTP